MTDFVYPWIQELKVGDSVIVGKRVEKVSRITATHAGPEQRLNFRRAMTYPCIVEGMSNEAYHSERDHVSSSALKVFIGSIPEYYGRYVTRTIPHPEPTPAMQLGTALHIMALEADQWPALVAVSPPTSTKTTNIWKEHVKANPGKLCLTPADVEAVSQMMHSLHENPEAFRLMTEPGRNELTVFWQHPSGLKCKTRFDRLTDSGTIVDIKTAADPKPDAFGKQIGNLGYHYSADFYRKCALLSLGYVTQFRHLAVGKSETVVCELGARFKAIANREVDWAIEELVTCQAEGNWASRFSGQVVTVDAPGWLK